MVRTVVDAVSDYIRNTMKNIRAVVLVGECGEIKYLKQRLERPLHLGKLIEPPYAYMAAERGAVMVGLFR